MTDWIEEFDAYDAAERYKRRLGAMCDVVYPTGWGFGIGPVPPGESPEVGNTCLYWSRRGVAAIDKVSFGGIQR